MENNTSCLHIIIRWFAQILAYFEHHSVERRSEDEWWDDQW